MDQLDDPQVGAPDTFESHANCFPHREAVICGKTRRTWGDFNRNCNRVAHALLRAGVGRGDRVALLMDNSVELLELLFGAVKAGACVVPLSCMLTVEQLVTLLDDSDACALFAGPGLRERIENRRAQLPKLHQWVAAGPAATRGSDLGWQDFDAFCAGVPHSMPALRYAPSDTFNIIYSSGTTGLPKGIVQTHRARTHWTFSNAIEMRFNDQSRALTTTALYSNGTWLMMLPVLFAGGTLVALPTFGTADFFTAVATEKITHTFMVPAQYMLLLADPALTAAGTQSLEVMLCAGSPLRRDTKRAVIERFGNKLYELYGFSEGFVTMLKPHQHAAKFETVGTPVLGFEMRIVDEAGIELPRGEIGEIAGTGAGIMRGYHKRDEATADLIWRDERGRSFIRSGDIGRLDADGFLTLLDRKKDMIISGGFNVFPADLEAVVAQYPGVADVTVIDVPHERFGETPLALVIAQPGVALDHAAIVGWANQRLAKHQWISAVEGRTEFPRNALGKVLKRLLREPYWTQV